MYRVIFCDVSKSDILLPNKFGDEIIDLHFSIWSNMVSLYIKIFCPFPFVQRKLLKILKIYEG